MDDPCGKEERKMTRVEELIDKISNLREISREIDRVSLRITRMVTGDCPKTVETTNDPVNPDNVLSALENLVGNIHTALISTTSNLNHLLEQVRVDAMEEPHP